jgi:hypothetical protein
MSSTNSTNSWYSIGTFYAGQSGYTLKIKIYLHAAYNNPSSSQDSVTEIFFKTSNGQSETTTFAGNSWYYSYGGNTWNTTPTWVSDASGTNAANFTLYLYLPAYCNGSHYEVSYFSHSNCLWSNNFASSSDPGSTSSSTVCVASSVYNIYNTNVGINTSNPNCFLQILGNSSTLASTAPDNGANHNINLVSSKTGTTPYSMALGVDASGGFGYINAAGNSNLQPVCLQTRGGNVGIHNTSPQYTLDVSGTLNTTGNVTVGSNITLAASTGLITATKFNATSDYRIKEDVKTLDETYNVDKIRPVIYKNKLTGNTDIGVIAHELQKEYPMLVDGEQDGKEIQSVNYNGLIGLLINEIQNLKNEIKEIKEKLDKK